ncbi:MAG: glycosyltransferase 87 family protein [Gaiellaceae bacterium]
MSPLRSRPEVAAAAGGLFLLCWGLVHRGFWSHGVLVDWPTYQGYGDAILNHGLVPYRDFAVEYPPGALPVFILPAAFGNYATAFAWEMAACGVALVGVVAAIRREAAFYVALTPVLAGSLILSRFDLWPALLTVSALAALLLERHRLGWGLLGAAVAAKLWPLVIVPLALVWSYRAGRLRAALAGLAVVTAVFAPFALIAPHGLWDSVRGQASRPLQIESLGASLFTAFGHPNVISSHGSQNVAGHDGVAALFALLQVAVLVALWVAFARGPATGDRLTRYAAASVCAFIAFGKVLSPQFLLWLIPLVPLVRGRRGLAATGLLTSAFVLTQVWFPRRYWDYVYAFDNAGIVLARNLVLVALLLVLIWPDPVARRAAMPHSHPGIVNRDGRV